MQFLNNLMLVSLLAAILTSIAESLVRIRGDHPNDDVTSNVNNKYEDAHDDNYLHFDPGYEDLQERYFDRKPSSGLHLQVVDIGSDTHSRVKVGHESINLSDGVAPCPAPMNGYLNCSSKELLNIPSYNWTQNITVYDLSNNSIQAIPEKAFSRYSNLQKLDLRRNQICKVFNLSFAYLSNLEELDLSWNGLVMNATTNVSSVYPNSVFVPLKKLTILRLNGNNPKPDRASLKYPSQALSVIESLKELYMDGLKNATFDKNFTRLTALTKLSLSGVNGFCDICQLRNDTFQFLKQLKHLDVSNCSVDGHILGKKTFAPLKRLEYLDVSDNRDLNMRFIDQVFYGLYNTTTLKTLIMDRVFTKSSLSVCLNSEYLKHFPQSVEHLSLVDNRLECIDRNVMSIIGTNLKFIDISKNPFLFGTYLLDLPKLRNLTTLQIINRYVANRLPVTYPRDPNFSPVTTGNCSLYARLPSDGPRGEPFVIHLPEKLKDVFIRYAGFKYILSRLPFDPNNSLENLVLERNYVTRLEGPMTGLHKLKTLTMIGDWINYIDEDFFTPFNASLKHLNLSSNHLGEFFEGYPNAKIFRNLVLLQTLDLSNNDIRSLGNDIFEGLQVLRFLKLSKNPGLVNITFISDISPFRKLHALWLDDTGVGSLPPQTRRFIDDRLKTHRFEVNMKYCPILCSCENLPFLAWMASSPAFKYGNGTYYKCEYPNQSSRHILDNYTSTVSTLSRQCTSHQTMFFIVGSVTLLVLVFIFVALVYRYRWKLRYLYYAAYLQLKSRRQENNGTSSFLYDVFICYAERDADFVIDTLSPELESRDVSVFIHARDFAAGEFIGSNIVRAVRTCRRTVVVVTRALAASTWCRYEIQMANVESANRGSPVLVFLLADSVTEGEMGVELLYNVRNNTYLPFPSAEDCEEHELQRLWDRLASDVKT